MLGDDVQQKGSLVDPEKLRFDFSHGKSLSDEELARVETLVDDAIAQELPVYAETAPQEQALKIHGLRAVFGEKYPPMVRVVSIGAPVEDLLADPANPKWRQFSIEFCGGTHLRTAADAAAFTITAEESVSKGIRRIVGADRRRGAAATEQAAAIDALILQSKTVADADVQTLIAPLQKAVAGATCRCAAARRGQAAVGQLQARQKAWEKASKAESGTKIDVAEVAGKLMEVAPRRVGGAS